MRAVSLVLVTLLGVVSVSALPQFFSNTNVPQVNSRTYFRDDSNQYAHGFDLNDGQAHQETGYLKNGPEGLVVVKKGFYRYPTPDGKLVSVEYLADENGFQILNSQGLPVDPAVEALKAQQQASFPQHNFPHQHPFGTSRF